MKKLLIVESPAKIKTISKFLGSQYKILSTVGHVKDLPTKELGVKVNGHIEIEYVVLENKDKVLKDIKAEAKKADEIYLAPDPDREGEIIAWHVANEIEKVVKDPEKLHRITFNEITKTAINDAIAHPTKIDMKKVAAQQARRILDRWVGYEVSPVLWRKISKGLSAGRVQSVALKLICSREIAIRDFKTEEYWTIDGLFVDTNILITAPLVQINKKKPELKNEKDTKAVIEKILKEQYKVDSIKDTKRLRNPNAPFMTSTLQQAAYNQLGFSVQRTMSLAQNLYEGVVLEDASTPVALITYMRTDSLRISDTALKQVRTYIDREFSKEYLPSKSNVYSKGKAQDAHEAIRPIDVNITPEYASKFLDSSLAKLYTLIWNRFVASQMTPAQYAQRQVTIKGGPYVFKVTGSTLIFDGFLKLYEEEEEEEVKDQGKVKLPKELKEGMDLKIKETKPKQHFTQPPPRYTEASLVKELEKEGIGRPSTYATIMKTIQARSYTTLDTKKRFVPTELGMHVTKILDENLPKIMNVGFTANMETDLDKIANGELDRDILLKEFYKEFMKDLEAFRGTKSQKATEPTDITCPKCKKGKLLIRFGKAGSFLGCSNYPECDFTSNFERKEDGTIELTAAEKPALLEEKCPACVKPLRQVIGKFGPFIACSGYPECKYIYQRKARFKCPPCGKGDVLERSWKGKKFWGCSNYPECKFTISGDIEETPCLKCKSPYLSKRFDKKAENFVLTCANKTCDYKEIRKSDADSDEAGDFQDSIE